MSFLLLWYTSTYLLKLWWHDMVWYQNTTRGDDMTYAIQCWTWHHGISVWHITMRMPTYHGDVIMICHALSSGDALTYAMTYLGMLWWRCGWHIIWRYGMSFEDESWHIWWWYGVAYLWTYVLTYDMTYLVGGVDICDDICGGRHGITAHVMICISYDISFWYVQPPWKFFFVFFQAFPYWLFLMEIFFVFFQAFPYWLFVIFRFSLLAFSNWNFFLYFF